MAAAAAAAAATDVPVAVAPASTDGGGGGGGRTFICYHSPCPDGTGAALATSLGLPRTCPPHMSDAEAAAEMRIEFVPLAVFRPEEERVAWAARTLAADDTVYIVDFSGGLRFIREVASRVASLVVLDHHKTAAADFDALVPPPATLTAVFDMARSGTGIARDYFGLAADSPWLVTKLGSAEAAAACLNVLAYIEDNDLWRHALPGSKDAAAGLHALHLSYDLPANLPVLRQLAGLSVPALIAAGAAAREAEEAVIAAAVTRAVHLRITLPASSPAATFDALGVIMPTGELRSNLGNALVDAAVARGLPGVGIVAYHEPGLPDAATNIKVSVRAATAGVDTTVMTVAYGGGGHAAASSCIVPRTTYDSWVVPAT